MAFIDILSAVGMYLWDSFKLWSHTIFIAPFQNFEMLWILIPIYLNWIFADFFQEKKGTSLGNAISNGIIPLWAGVDWVRQTVNAITIAKVTSKVPWTVYASKFAIAAFVLFYGFWIIWEGIWGKELTKYIGRIREVTYLVIMLTPVIYNVTPITFQLFFSIILFFPIFYYFVELLDHIMPDPASIQEETGKSGKSSSPNFGGGSSGDDPFASSSSPMSSSNDPFSNNSGNDPFSNNNSMANMKL